MNVMHDRTLRLGLILMLAALGATACTDDGAVGDGALSLQWTAGPASSCDDAGIQQVDVLFRKGGQVVSRRTFPCEAGGAFIDAVEPGRYAVAVQGVDDGGRATFEGVIDDVQIEDSREIDLGMVRMTARHARVQLQWFFDNGRLCSQNLVDKVAVNVYDSELYMIGSSEFVCDAGLGELDPLPAGGYEIEMLGLGTGGTEVRARRVLSVELGRGDDRVIDASMAMVAGTP